MPPMTVTLEVSKLDTSIFVKLEQAPNIYCMLVTLLVLNELKFNSVNEEQL